MKILTVAFLADNSAGHVAYEASGIGGKPSLLFDGNRQRPLHQHTLKDRHP
ncbi:MAG: hypothetical protein IJL17_01275 [Kiritimatiellae bacterium]|nr:hypothetical protein [Kiritimatiellia bacterium]